MSMTATDESNVDELLNNLKELQDKSVNVGILGSADSKIKMIAGVHEFGCDIKVTPAMRNYLHYIGIHLKKSTTVIKIPERSFIRAGADASGVDVEKETERLIDYVINGDLEPQEAAELLGEMAKGEIQKFAIALRNPPNKSATIANKGSSNPLVDTGKMIDSIDWEVV